MDQGTPATTPAERTLVIVREFQAPRALVFRAWTDPTLMRRWMGPRSHPMCAGDGDVRPGGAWRAALRPAQGGPDLWQGGRYLEVVEPERLVFTFAWDGEDGRRGLETVVSVNFAETGGVTTMTFRQSVFETESSRDSHGVGWSSTFDRLEEFFAGPS